MAIAELGVHPPTIVDQSILTFELRVQIGARCGRERIEVGQIEFVADRELDGLVKGFDRILIVAEHERAVDHDARILEDLDRTLIVTVFQVPALPHLLQTAPGSATQTQSTR